MLTSTSFSEKQLMSHVDNWAETGLIISIYSSQAYILFNHSKVLSVNNSSIRPNPHVPHCVTPCIVVLT